MSFTDINSIFSRFFLYPHYRDLFHKLVNFKTIGSSWLLITIVSYTLIIYNRQSNTKICFWNDWCLWTEMSIIVVPTPETYKIKIRAIRTWRNYIYGIGNDYNWHLCSWNVESDRFLNWNVEPLLEWILQNWHWSSET